VTAELIDGLAVAKALENDVAAQLELLPRFVPVNAPAPTHRATNTTQPATARHGWRALHVATRTVSAVRLSCMSISPPEVLPDRPSLAAGGCGGIGARWWAVAGLPPGAGVGSTAASASSRRVDRRHRRVFQFSATSVEEAGASPARSRHCDRGAPGARHSLPSQIPERRARTLEEER
jgi:hypothetical protein